MFVGVGTVLICIGVDEFGLAISFLLFAESRAVLYEVIVDRMYAFFTSCMRRSSM